MIYDVDVDQQQSCSITNAKNAYYEGPNISTWSFFLRSLMSESIVASVGFCDFVSSGLSIKNQFVFEFCKLQNDLGDDMHWFE